MTKPEFAFQVHRMALAFEKSVKDDLLELWWEECRGFGIREIQNAVRFFLDSDQKVFPKIGEFKIAIRGKERKTPEGKQPDLASCLRCSHGFCSVERWIGNQKYSYTLRCSCPSGDHYPGLPLVSPNEQTVKERQRREGVKPTPSSFKLPQPLEFPSIVDTEIPF